MTVRFTWRGPEFEQQFQPVLNGALTKAAAAGADGAAREIKARPANPGQDIGAGQGRVSRPGESPTTQLGILRQSVTSTEAEGLRAGIGSGLKYARWLELGTSKMAARPWLLRGVMKSRRKMGRIFTRQAVKGFKRINLSGGG